MKRLWRQGWLLGLLALPVTALSATDAGVWLATQADGQPLSWHSSAGAPVPAAIREGKVPLGSVWKLFSWIYLTGNQLPETPYVCKTPSPRPGEEYCCEPGQQIGRDEALVRSCGAYFDSARWGITATTWRQWWQRHTPLSPWLHELSLMRPDHSVTVAELLLALQQVPAPERARVREALLGRLLQPRWQPFLEAAGSGYRFKTFTWDDPVNPGGLLGGGAGWLVSGQPFWLGGRGRSVDVFARAASELPTLLPLPGYAANVAADQCVEIRFFERYPLAEVRLADGQLALPGSLHGRHVAHFANGRQLIFEGNGQLQLTRLVERPVISGRFGLEEYVARVIDREADARESAAAQALAVAVRSWLFQNAAFGKGCWQVTDDTRTQRVSPNPPTAAAWRAAWFTEGLSLTGQPVFYHLNNSEGGRLSWQAAVSSSRSGESFVRILTTAYPRASFSLPSGDGSCRRLPAAEAWLRQRLPKVREILYAQPGYEPVEALQICQLNHGNPYSDQRQQRLWIRRLGSRDDRVTLWHEYLHIAFRDHPAGRNETHVEALARRLEETP